MKIREIMTRDPACCSPDTSLEEVARMMVVHDCGSVPVCDGADSRRVIGVITDRDIVVRTVAAGRNPLELRAKDIMSHPVAMVEAEHDVHACVHALEANQIRRAPVIDEQGRLVGVVAQADIARHARVDEIADLVQHVSQGPDIGHAS